MVWLVLLGLVVLAGCAAPGLKHVDMQALGFKPHGASGQVWLEAGAEALATRVDGLLAAAMARVEGVHGRRFRTPPEIYVCASEACFARLVRTPNLTAAVVADNRLVLSPRLAGREAWRLPGILVHELSHVHLGQWLGHYSPWVPVWFHEGLATLVADGAGAEALGGGVYGRPGDEGARIDFARRDAPGRRHGAQAFGMELPTFYLHSWRMVAALRRHSPQAFERWLHDLLDGRDFHIAFADAYNTDLAALTRALEAGGALETERKATIHHDGRGTHPCTQGGDRDRQTPALGGL